MHPSFKDQMEWQRLKNILLNYISPDILLLFCFQMEHPQQQTSSVPLTLVMYPLLSLSKTLKAAIKSSIMSSDSGDCRFIK